MRLNTKFILFVVVIHTTALLMSFYIFRENRLFFLASECLILISLAICWSLYGELIRPLQLLARGVEAIKDKDFNVKFVKTGKSEMDLLIGVYNDMMDQLRAERTRQEEQHYFLEKLVHTAPTGIIALDYDGCISDLNPKAMALLEQSPESVASALKGRLPAALGHPILEGVAQLANNESATVTLPDARTFKLQKAHFVDRGFPRAFILIEDLTAEILEAEKRSYGKVIRMMAHEVNNSIGAVNSILDTTAALYEQGAPIEVEALHIAIARNNRLNAFMRNFADVIRLPEPQRERMDLNALLRDIAQLMSYKASERGVFFQWDLAPEPVYVHADKGQMEQVLINIVKNAIEAYEPDKSGPIVFHTRLRPRSLRITDEGKGIDAAIKQHIFSPFFTHKNGGQGIGLTLAREALNAHGFGFSLQTDAEKRTHFDIIFK